MKESIYKSYEELPLFLNAQMVAKLLGISPSSSYELMHEKGFPVLRVGNRLVVPKEKFHQWVEEQIIPLAEAHISETVAWIGYFSLIWCLLLRYNPSNCKQ